MTGASRPRRPRVGVFTGYIPEYRDAVFGVLDRNEDFEFFFLSSVPPPCSFIKRSAGASYRSKPIRVISLHIAGTPNSVTLIPGVIGAMLRRDYDVFILRNDILQMDVWLACTLSRLLRIPVCVWGQGLSRPPGPFRDGIRWILTRLATAALYYTEGGRQYWVSKGIPSRKLFVAYNSLDTNKQIRIRKSLSCDMLNSFLDTEGMRGKTVVTFLGRLIREKKPWVFIDAVERALTLNPSIVGVIIGDGPERHDLEKQAEDKGISGNVRFLGAIYDEEVIARYLSVSVAVVIPAFAGLAIQHAAVYGVPLVLGSIPHSHGPEAEIVQDNRTGIWCDDEDADAFASAIIRLATDHDLRHSISGSLRQEIESHYSVGRMAQGFIEAVDYCLHTSQ